MRLSRLIALCLGMPLAACGHGGEAASDLPAAIGPPVPVALAGLSVDVPRGRPVGGYGFGLLCAPPYNDIAWNQRPAWGRQLADAVRDGMAAGGAALADDARRGPPQPPPPWRLSARVTRLDYDLCRAVDLWFGKRTGETGSARVTVEWALQRDGQPAVTLTTQGEGGSQEPAITDSKLLILGNALADAASTLAARPEFRTALSSPPTAITENHDETGIIAEISDDQAETRPIGDARLTIHGGRKLGNALLLDEAGTAILAIDTKAEWISEPPLDLLARYEGGGEVLALSLSWHRPAAAALLRLDGGQAPLPGIAPARRRSPPGGSLLHPPGMPDALSMVAARRDGGPAGLPILLLDLPAGLAPPPFLLDADGRLAAIIAGPALAGELQPYHPAAPLLTMLRERQPDDQGAMAASQSAKADKAGPGGLDFGQVSQ